MRKFWLTFTGLVSFTVIMIISQGIDPFNLGMGLGLLITPAAVANAFEHKFKNGK